MPADLSSCISAIQKIRTYGILSSIHEDLELIQKFLEFVKNLGFFNDDSYQQLREFVSIIEDAFETAVTDIQYAVQTNEEDAVDAFKSKFNKKIKLFRFRISRATQYFSSTSTTDEAVPDNLGDLVWSISINAFGHLDAVDLALETLTGGSMLGYEPEWISVRLGFELIQTFLTFAPKWSDANEIIRDHLGDLLSSIEDAFETAGQDVFYAITKGEAKVLSELRDKLIEKIEILKPRILTAYKFLSEYAFETSAPHLPVFNSMVWTSFCNRVVLNACAFYGMLGFGGDSLYIQVCGIEQRVRDLINLYFIIGSNHSALRDLAFSLEGVLIGVARLLFLWWVEETDEDDQNMMLSELSRKVKLMTFEEILACYLAAINIHEFESVPKLFMNGLESGVQQLQTLSDVKDGKINWFKYSSDTELDMHFQLSQQIVLLRLEIILRDLNEKAEPISNGAFEFIRRGLGMMETFLWCPACKRANSEKLILICKGIYQVVQDAEFVHRLHDQEGDSGSESSRISIHELKLKLNLDFKILKIQAFVMEQMRCIPSISMASGKDKIHTLGEGVEILLRSERDFETNKVLENMSLLLSSFLEHINLFTTDIKALYLEVQRMSTSVLNFNHTQYGLPKIVNGVAIVDIFSEKLHECLHNKPTSMEHSLKSQIEAVVKVLDSLRSILEEIGETTKLKLILILTRL